MTEPASMKEAEERPRKDYIPELRAKLTHLMKLRARSWKNFRVHTGVTKTALDRAFDTASNKNHNKLGFSHQKSIADHFGFPVDWDLWRIGRAAEFCDQYDRMFKLQYLERGEESASTPDSSLGNGATVATTRRSRAPGAGDKFPKIEVDDSEGPDSDTILASILIEGKQPGLGTLTIHLKLYCGIAAGGALRRGQISLNPASGRMTLMNRDEWRKDKPHPSKVKSRSSEAIFRCYRSERDPVWEVDGQGGPIGDIEFRDFCGLERLLAGDEVVATFSAWLADIDYSDAQDVLGGGDDLLIVYEDVRASDKSWSELGKVRQRLIKMILSEAGHKVMKNGRVELSRHVLKIIEDDEK